MANKRMFTMKIVDSDAFLEMPLSTQCLYFHLNMRADDDGFIGNPKKVMKIVGASDDDLKLLIAKRFVLCFEDGVIVIKHWRMHNTLSQNRYHETQYTEEKSMLRIKENGSYSFENGEEINDNKLINAKEKYDKKESACERLTNGLQTADSDKDLDLGLDKDLDKDLVNTPPISPSKAETEDKGNTKKKTTKASNPKVFYPNDEKLNQAFLDFMAMRNSIKKPMTDRAITMAMNKLERLSAIPFSDSMDNDLAIKILEQSTFACWTDLYALKEDRKKSQSSSSLVDEWRNA